MTVGAGRSILRLSSLDQGRVQWILGDLYGESQFSHDGRLGAVHEALANEPYILLPGSDVLLTEAEVPSRRRTQVLAAIPYSVEEDLAGDAEEFCFGVSKTDEGGVFSVACAARQAFDAMLARLGGAGIRPRRVLPDLLAVPYNEDEWSLLVLEDLVLVRTGKHTGFASEGAALSFYLAAALEETQSIRPKLVNVFVGAEPDSAAAVRVVNEFGLHVAVQVHPRGNAFWWFERGLEDDEGVDFLEGRPEFSSLNVEGKRFRLIGALMSLWICVIVGTKFWDYSQLRSNDARLRYRIEELFRETVPEVRRIVNPKQQIAQKLTELRDATGGSSLFLPLLTDVSAELADFPNLQIMNVNYARGKLDIDIQVPDLAELDQLKQRLRARGVLVEVLSANNQGSLLRGRLRVQPMEGETR